ncbi:hypothetical protein NPIL_332451 [Nephila pilipes]|uniref:Uncharacterized protein n=1 Tax=Nephila pilipes TaxID=299642 RepID=A0A8X6MUD4_NEPPI|nr:hypothetical protein NPIL_332451 [Nephila pilipes]
MLIYYLKITLTSIGIEVLRNDSLKKIASTLQDLHIQDALELREIEANALKECLKIRTLHITRAPKLKQITNGVFSAHFPSFKMLRIAHSGLEVIPNMNLLKTDPTIIAMMSSVIDERMPLLVFNRDSMTDQRYWDEVLEAYVWHFKGACGFEVLFLDDDACIQQEALVGEFIEIKTIE